MKSTVVVPAAVVAALALSAPATAATSWDPWGGRELGVRARTSVGPLPEQPYKVVQFDRSAKPAGVRQVAIRWRPTTAGEPTGAWQRSAWTRLGPGGRVKLRTPDYPCYPYGYLLQALVRKPTSEGARQRAVHDENYVWVSC